MISFNMHVMKGREEDKGEETSTEYTNIEYKNVCRVVISKRIITFS